MKFARIVLTTVGMVVLAAALSGILIPKAGQAMATLLVQVVNTPNVNVSSMPPVEVSSLPAVQLSGTSSVNVANGITSPLPALPAEALNSFVSEKACEWGQNLASNLAICVSQYSVPANKVAVIESVSGNCAVQSGTTLVFVAGENDTSNEGLFYISPSAPVPFLGFAYATYGMQMKSYVNGGSSGATFEVQDHANSDQAVNGSCVNIVAGYLIPTQ